MRSRLMALLLVLPVVATVSCSRNAEQRKRQYVESGDKYVAEQKYPEAIIEYRNAVAQDAKYGEARFKLAETYAQTGEFRSALREYQRAADLLPNDVEAQLRAGHGLLAAGQFNEARARALHALAKDPKNVRALILMGNALAGMKDLDGAITQIENAVDADPRRTLTYSNLGVLELAKGNRSSAEAAFKRAVELEPKAAAAHLALANYYWAGNQRPEAEGALKAALQAEPQSAAANRALGLFYIQTNRKSDAEQFLKAYADLAKQVGPKLVLADFYMMDRRPAEAVAVLQPLIDMEDGFIPAKGRLASIDFAAGRKEQAYAALDEILAREPKNENALLGKGRFLMADGKPSDALAQANAALTGNPKSVPGHYLKGSSLKAIGSMDEARAAFQEVLRLSPSAVPALNQLADLSLASGDAAAAVEFSRQAIKNQPQSGVAHLIYARSMLRLGNLKAAEPEVMALAKGNPASAEVQVLLGDLHWMKRDSTRARQAYQQALALESGSIDALAGLVRADLAEKKPDAARSRMEAQLAKAPDDQALLLLASNTFTAAGDAKRAESTLRHMLQVNPSATEAHARLGALYLSQRRLDEAKKEYEEMARVEPKAAGGAAAAVATILIMQGKTDEARKSNEEALAKDPQMPIAANNLAWDYAETGRNLDLALQLAQSAKAKLPNSAQVSDTLGWIYYKKDMATLSIASLREAVKQAPSNPSIHYRLGLAYLKNGESERARDLFQQALKLNPQFKEAEDAKRVLATMKG